MREVTVTTTTGVTIRADDARPVRRLVPPGPVAPPPAVAPPGVVGLVEERVRWLRALAGAPGLRRGGPAIALGPGARIRLGEHGRFLRGRGVCAGRNLTAHVQGVLAVGDGVVLGDDAHLSVLGDVGIGRGVRFAERVSLHDENPAAAPDRPRVEWIRIGDGVRVGATCVITAGSVIGAGSVIAAGSVVQGVIPPNVLAAGVPADVVRRLA